MVGVMPWPVLGTPPARLSLKHDNTILAVAAGREVEENTGLGGCGR
jgi:hypothetical protein